MAEERFGAGPDEPRITEEDRGLTYFVPVSRTSKRFAGAGELRGRTQVIFSHAMDRRPRVSSPRIHLCIRSYLARLAASDNAR